jgi:hypothetical protein
MAKSLPIPRANTCMHERENSRVWFLVQESPVHVYLIEQKKVEKENLSIQICPA